MSMLSDAPWDKGNQRPRYSLILETSGDNPTPQKTESQEITPVRPSHTNRRTDRNLSPGTSRSTDLYTSSAIETLAGADIRSRAIRRRFLSADAAHDSNGTFG